MRVAPQVALTENQKHTLLQWARGRSLPARQVERARVVLLASAGRQDLEIAAEVGISNQKAARWRKGFLKLGLDGLEQDAPRPGRPSTLTSAKVQEVIRKTTQEKPANATHWSTRTMAKAAGLSEKTVRRIWHKHGLKPHLVESCKVSKDPQFAEKLEAIVGLYLNPPEHALVLCCDEKSQIQALDRTQPGLPLKPGRAGTMTHDYKRNGTATLFAALNTVDGKVISLCQERHRHQEFIRFLNDIDAQLPKRQAIDAIVDNYATHKHPKVRQWLARHPRWTFHFTPTSASWLNAVEDFFAKLTRRRLKRGVFRSVVDLQVAINRFIDEVNHDPKPVVWTANPRKILAAVNRGRQVLDSIH